MPVLIKYFSTRKMQEAYWRLLSDIDKIIDFANTKNIPLAVVIFPTGTQIKLNLHLIQEKISSYLGQRKIKHINFTKVWINKAKYDKQDYSEFILSCGHFNKIGHNVVAQELSHLLKKNHFIRM